MSRNRDAALPNLSALWLSKEEEKDRRVRCDRSGALSALGGKRFQVHGGWTRPRPAATGVNTPSSADANVTSESSSPKQNDGGGKDGGTTEPAGAPAQTSGPEQQGSVKQKVQQIEDASTRNSGAAPAAAKPRAQSVTLPRANDSLEEFASAFLKVNLNEMREELAYAKQESQDRLKRLEECQSQLGIMKDSLDAEKLKADSARDDYWSCNEQLVNVTNILQKLQDEAQKQAEQSKLLQRANAELFRDVVQKVEAVNKLREELLAEQKARQVFEQLYVQKAHDLRTTEEALNEKVDELEWKVADMKQTNEALEHNKNWWKRIRAGTPEY